MVYRLAITLKTSYFSANSPNHVEFHEQSLIELIENGQIGQIIHQSDPDYQKTLTAAQTTDQLITIAPGHYLLPGFIDLHNHAPQWPQAGIALDRPLNDWLNHYTFPLEARFADLDYATAVYRDLVHTLLTNGTTSVLYFGSIHNNANLKLAEICAQLGQRAFIGTVVMDNPEQTPANYRDVNSATALSKTRTFIQAIQNQHPDQLVQPVITPRFIPSCQTETLTQLGRLAQETQLRVQTHCSESTWEHQYVLDRFGQTDSVVLQQFGLLNQHAVLAHATQLTTADQQLIKTEQAAIAHCPLSNAYFGNGVFPTKQLLDQQLKIGLGTDIAGGYSPSLYTNLQTAVTASQMRQDGVDARLPADSRGVADSRITTEEAFYLATAGGAASLAINAGQIKPGMLADFQIVQAAPQFTTLTPADQLTHLLFNHTAQQIKAVYVNGQLVHQKEQNWYDNAQ